MNPPHPLTVEFATGGCAGIRRFLRGSSSQGYVAQLLAGTDAGTGVRGHVGGAGGILLFSPTVGERRDTHTHTHTQRNKHRNVLGNGPNTVSGSTVSNSELSEFFGAH